MIFDLDRLLAVEEIPPEGDRIFHFDVFISHRRFDLPKDLLNALAHLGITFAWDNDLDLSDRRVLHFVARAMEASRYIALYVSNRYTDSPWCRAEYLSALQFEKHFLNFRVFVILESARSAVNIPPVLAAQPRFNAEATEIATLVEFLRTGNNMKVCSPNLLAAKISWKGRLGPDTSLLDTAEQLNLLEHRLQRWLEVGGTPQTASELEQKAIQVIQLTATQFTELESILRDVKRHTLKSTINFMPSEDHSEVALEHIVRIGALVANAFDNPLTQSSAKQSSEWLYDFILLPLLLPIMRDQTRSFGLKTYREICARLSSTPMKANVKIYRMVGEAAALYPGSVDSIIQHALVRLLQVGKRKSDA